VKIGSFELATTGPMTGNEHSAPRMFEKAAIFAFPKLPKSPKILHGVARWGLRTFFCGSIYPGLRKPAPWAVEWRPLGAFRTCGKPA
jgi:hypothetical protein